MINNKIRRYISSILLLICFCSITYEASAEWVELVVPVNLSNLHPEVTKAVMSCKIQGGGTWYMTKTQIFNVGTSHAVQGTARLYFEGTVGPQLLFSTEPITYRCQVYLHYPYDNTCAAGMNTGTREDGTTGTIPYCQNSNGNQRIHSINGRLRE